MSPAPGQSTLSPASKAAVSNAEKTLALLDVENTAAEVRKALAAFLEQPETEQLWQNFLSARREASATIAKLPRRLQQDPAVTAARELIRAISKSGVLDTKASAEDLALAQSYSTQGWPGLLAAMLLAPGWQWAQAPSLERVPDWLWSDYTAWIFTPPQGFSAVGQADVYAEHILQRLEELTRWADRAAGSAAVKAALNTYATQTSSIPLYFSSSTLRRHAELRGRLLLRAIGNPHDDFIRLPEPRAGRKLRVGFVNRHFGSQTETYTTLPSFEHLDPQHFEVHLFAHHTNGSPLETYCRSRVQEFHVLPEDRTAQVAALREANLDVAVFGTNVTAVVNEITLLALYRVAPLQAVNNSSCITSGLPQVDVYISGNLTECADAPSHFSERLALLPGPAHAFNYTADQQEPSANWTRGALGIPEDAPLFVTAANYYKIIPEMQEAWARLLEAVPGSRLLLHPFNPNWSSDYPIKRFCAEFDRLLAAHGISNDRLIVSSIKFPSRSDVKELMRLGDVYLDTYPFGGVNSLIDPLEVGVPVIAWEGETFRSRMGAALLRSLKLDELIVRDAAAYQALGARLATDKPYGETLRTRITEAMARTPLFLDTLAASDAFGSLLELAYDELTMDGLEEFRKKRTPLSPEDVGDPTTALAAASYLFEAGMEGEAASQARHVLASQPASPEARHLLGAALLRQGNTKSAVQYLLAALEHAEGNAALWHDIAIALGRIDRLAEAIQAFETCVTIDKTRLDSWLLLGEYAFAAQATEKIASVSASLQKLFPNDPRVQQFLKATATKTDPAQPFA